MKDTQGSWEYHASRNMPRGQSHRPKGIIPRPWNLVAFARLCLEITWDQCLLFCFQCSFCLNGNTCNCYPMPGIPVTVTLCLNTCNCYLMLGPPLCFEIGQFLPFIHRPTDGKKLYPRMDPSQNFTHNWYRRWIWDLCADGDFGLWVDALIEWDLGGLGMRCVCRWDRCELWWPEDGLTYEKLKY